MLIYLNGKNSKMGDNSDKKIRVTYFFMRNPYMKFQNISLPGSKVMLCNRKRDERTNERTHEQANEPTNRQARSNMPTIFFQSGGHNKYKE